ncbi:hypothetical protein [Acinetobacter sp. Q186-3]|uniref:hypothetical protein n=2 Tax=Moraxellaceae TaxID=468 RepID=UPI0015D1BEE5|nr:hypothetical protein [Acinetobacter sp. Q186-3]
MCNHQVFRTMRFPVNSRQMHKQAGFASILLILLIGLALTTLVIGMVTSVRSLQDSSLTTHAQTQAQIKSAIGYQALSGLLETLNATQIDQIDNGEIKDGTTLTATYKKVTTDCPAEAGGTQYFCYDITAKSGGASSVVRAIYTEITTGGGAFDGSIFAGGLEVGHERNLQGNQTIQVGDAGKGSGIVKGNGNNYYTVEDFLDGTGFTVKPYQPTTFLTAEELRPSSNYIFYANGKCAKNNLYGASIYNTETEPVTCSSISGITVSGSGASKKWTIDAASSAIPAGVLWFEGEVDINLKSSRDLVNTIIATGDMQVITTNQGGAGKAYAPYHYYLESSTDLTTKKARICGSSATGIPTQYCDTTGTLKTIDTERTKISNILFFSDKIITFEVKNNSPMSLYGNIMGIGGGGGTSSSGKFNGTGVINIKGNLTFTGKGVTKLNGHVNVILNNGSSGGSATPAQKVMTLSGLRYM